MADMIRIAMTPGPYRRELGDYVWDEANGFTADVDIATAANLLTYPGGGYRLSTRPKPAAVKALAEAMGLDPKSLVLPAEGETTAAPVEPQRTVAQIAGGKWALQLTEHGIHKPEQLATLDEAGMENLAAASGASREEVRAWVKQAKSKE